MEIQNHKELLVWQKGMQLVKHIYRLTALFPTSERYGLSSQMQRCAVSIPSNISEGCGRRSKGELTHFLSITLGSCAELETQLLISKELDYTTQNDIDELLKLNSEIIRMSVSLIKSINRPAPTSNP